MRISVRSIKNNQQTPMKSALILKDRKRNKIFHVIVEEADKLQQYINLDDTKTEYTIIPDWELVKEAIKYLIQK
jgi:hypothetical protein